MYEKFHCRAGPINVLFFGVATAWDVWYDMTHVGWSQGVIDWQTTKAAARSAFFFDEMHGGADAWIDTQDYDMQPDYDERCWDNRHHIRVWESATGDIHDGQIGEFGRFTVGQAHWEHHRGGDWHPCQHSVQSQSSGRDKVEDTFRAGGNGDPLWFVGDIYYIARGSAGTDWDGDLVASELLV